MVFSPSHEISFIPRHCVARGDELRSDLLTSAPVEFRESMTLSGKIH